MMDNKQANKALKKFVRRNEIMKHIRNIVMVYVVVICMAFCSGCTSKHNSSSDVNTDSDSDLSSIISSDDDLIKKSEGSVSMGFKHADKYEYTYSGSEMKVPLYVGATDNSENTEVAAMLFLNGEVQPYSYTLNGKVSKKQMVHYFTLGPDETINFTALVTPISGKKGDVVGMQFATVFRSDYLPKQDGNTSFGNCGHINSTICIPVKMQASGINETKADTVKTTITDIPEETMAMLEGLVANDTDNPLDYSSYLEIKTADKRNRLYSKNGKLNLTLQMYGGKEVAKKITFFINNEPVKVDNCDYCEVNTTTDKMTVFDVSIDVSKYKEPCSFYAVAATSGEDYVIQDDTTQSERCLLINK